METKICNGCLQEVSLKNFRKNKFAKSGLRSICKACESQYQKERRLHKKEDLQIYNQTWAKANPIRKKIAKKLWVEDNYDKVLSYNSSRRSGKKRATLPGYEKEVEEIYWLARDLRTITGENYQVDHVVPLKGKNVCGLHVPWNLQVLPSDLNMSKGNKF